MRFTFDLDILWQCLETWSQYTCFRNPEGKLTEFEGFPDIPEEIAEHYRALAQDVNLVNGKGSPRVTVEALDFLKLIRYPELKEVIHRTCEDYGIREALISASRYLFEIRNTRAKDDEVFRRFLEEYEGEDLFEDLEDSRWKA